MMVLKGAITLGQIADKANKGVTVGSIKPTMVKLMLKGNNQTLQKRIA
jgi:hypothetical protein